MQEQPHMQPQAQYPDMPPNTPLMSMPMSPNMPPMSPPQPVQSQYTNPYQPQQSPYIQAPMMQPPMMQQSVNVNIQTSKQHGFLSRAIYFCFIGWWLGFAWLNVGYALCVTVIGLPIGLAMLNRLPRVLTLRPSSAGTTSVNVSTTSVAQPSQPGVPGAAPIFMQTVNVNVNVGNGNGQQNFLIRALYFVCIGWWLGYTWALIGYALCMMIVTLPIGLIMLNRLPAVITLRKN